MVTTSLGEGYWMKHRRFGEGNCLMAQIKFSKNTGGRLNKKDGLTRYGDSHVKDKTS